MKARHSVSARYPETHRLKDLLEAIEAREVLARQRQILIKPNLINDSPPPVTVPVELVAALIDALRTWSDATIVVAEGVGAPGLRPRRRFASSAMNKWRRPRGCNCST